MSGVAVGSYYFVKKVVLEKLPSGPESNFIASHT